MGFITLFLIPALSASFLLSPDHESFPVVKRIPDKQSADDQDSLLRKQDLSYYSVALIVPSAFLVFMTQVVSLIDLGSTSIADIFAHPVFPPALIEQAQVSSILHSFLFVVVLLTCHLNLMHSCSANFAHMVGPALPHCGFVVCPSSRRANLSAFSRCDCPCRLIRGLIDALLQTIHCS
jgi:hypothetical protein